MISREALWFRYRAGVVAEAERLVHVSGLPIGRSYLIAACGRWFDRGDTERTPDPRGPSPGGFEPCVVCVMHVLLGAVRLPDSAARGHDKAKRIDDRGGRSSAANDEEQR